MDFPTAWEAHRDDIERLSHSQYVPGMDPDDVASEMSICLWKATKTYREGPLKFDAYWWSVWLNRKYDLTKTHYAGKRVRPILTGFNHESVVASSPDPFPMPPSNDPLEVMVWVSLAEGGLPKEIQDDFHISRRKYYDIVRRWRNDDVRRSLSGS